MGPQYRSVIKSFLDSCIDSVIHTQPQCPLGSREVLRLYRTQPSHHLVRFLTLRCAKKLI